MVEIHLRQKGRSQRSISRKPFAGSGKSVFSKLLNLNIGLGPALAMMLFLVAGVATASLAVNQDLVNNTEKSIFAISKASQKAQVLGLASYGYQQPVCANNVCMRYELIGYSASEESWAADIFYYPQYTSSNFRGSIRANGQRFAYNITGAGVTSTGYNLDPGETYNFAFRAGLRGTGRVLNRLSITMPDVPTSSTNVCPAVEPGPNCVVSSYYTDQNGCLRIGLSACQQPAYAYQIVNVGPVNQSSWREGWIESVYYASSNAPGNVVIYGWAYDEGKNISLTMKLKNSLTGQYFYPSSTGFYTRSTNDVHDYLGSKRQGGSTHALSLNFSVKFIDLPAGQYYIEEARYNGYLFNLHQGSAYQPINIDAQKPLPSYGYQGILSIQPSASAGSVSPNLQASGQGQVLVPINIANTGGSNPYSISSISFRVNPPSALNFISRMYLDVEGASPQTSYQRVGDTALLTFPQNWGLCAGCATNFVLKADLASNATGSFSVMPISVSYPTLSGNYVLPSWVAGISQWWSQTFNILQTPQLRPIIFSANGQSKITVLPGQTVNYTWQAPFGTPSVDSVYTADKADTCPGGISTVGETKPWVANSLNGSVSAVIQPCQAGVTYVMEYRSASSTMAKLSVQVGSTTTTSAGSFKANGNLITFVNPGQAVRYTWQAPSNAVSASSYYYADKSDTCTGGFRIASGTNGKDPQNRKPWVANSLSGEIVANTDQSCQTGVTYMIVYEAKDASGNVVMSQNISVGVGVNTTISSINTDLAVNRVFQSGADPNSFTFNVCVYGDLSINELKKINGKITNFPWAYVVYDAGGQKYMTVMNASGSVENLKNGCSDLGFVVQPNDRAYLNATGKIDVFVDNYDYIFETNETNNRVSTHIPVSTSTSSVTSYRYVTVSTPSSNSWVGWREIEIYDRSGTKLTFANVNVSATYSQSSATFAYDNNPNTAWASGQYNGEIKLDFGSNKNIGKIRMLPANYPSPASVTHFVRAKVDGSLNEILITSFGNSVTDNIWLEYIFP